MKQIIFTEDELKSLLNDFNELNTKLKHIEQHFIYKEKNPIPISVRIKNADDALKSERISTSKEYLDIVNGTEPFVLPFALEKNGVYKTRNGFLAKVTALFGTETHPAIGFIIKDKQEHSCVWTLNGKCYNVDYDIIEKINE